MVLTRLSHVGEVCPLSDHSYSDPVPPSNSQASTNKRIVSVAKGSPDDTGAGTSTSVVEQGERVAPSSMHILEFPTEILEKMLSFLTFANIRENRMVCKRFDKIGANLLNITFQKLQNQMLVKFQATKSQMPRRESARRKHHLARESDILETLHMRLTLLQMTFGKHIERKHCCFFAGEILDEVYRILRGVKHAHNMGKVFKITDELFDLSTMAMEYFKEHIEPSLPEISYFGSEFLDITTRFSEGGSSRCSGVSGRLSEPEDDFIEREPLPASNNVALKKRIRKIRQGMRRYSNQLGVMKKEMRACRTRIADQNKQLMEYFARMEEYDRKIDDSQRKFSTVLQELNKCKTELQYWRSKSPVHPICMHCDCGRFGHVEPPGLGDAAAPWADGRLMLQPHRVARSEAVAREAAAAMHSPQALPLLPSYYSSFLPSPASSVKNLEPLFDVETTPPTEMGSFPPPLPLSLPTQLPCQAGASSSSSSFPSAASSSSFPSSTSSLSFSMEKEFGGVVDGISMSSLHHKRSSSDDDTDMDVDDTVGRRVKERKRVKVDAPLDL